MDINEGPGILFRVRELDPSTPHWAHCRTPTSGLLTMPTAPLRMQGARQTVPGACTDGAVQSMVQRARGPFSSHTDVREPPAP